MRLLVKGARVVSPADKIDGTMDLLVADGRIAALGHELPAEEAEICDAAGLLLLPGLVDLHAHMGEPGHEDREDLDSGSLAAARGGYTTVVMMPDTDPVLDNPAAVSQAVGRGKQARVHVLVAGALTKRLAGEEMAELAALKEAGATALVQPDTSIAAGGTLRRMLQYVRDLGVLIAEQPHDASLVADGLMHEGLMSTIYGMKGIPASAEETIVARDILLAAETGCPLHLSRISTAGAVRQIAAAKAQGVPITCDVSPYHLVLSDEAVADYDPNCKLMPPLRSRADVAALQAAVADGTIDCVATDHTPLTPEEKDVEFAYAPYGAIALDMAFPLLYTELVHPGRLTLDQLLRAMSCRPAQLLHIADQAGTLQPGAPADFVLVDPRQPRQVDRSTIRSHSKNTPVLGRKLQGWPVATYVDGRLTWRNDNK